MSEESGGFELALDRPAADDGGPAILRVSGELDLGVADQFEVALRSATESGAAVILDLREVTFADSSGLRVMLVGADKLGPRMAFVIEPDSALSRLLDLAEVSDRLPIFPSEEGARSAIEGGTTEERG